MGQNPPLFYSKSVKTIDFPFKIATGSSFYHFSENVGYFPKTSRFKKLQLEKKFWFYYIWAKYKCFIYFLGLKFDFKLESGVKIELDPVETPQNVDFRVGLKYARKAINQVKLENGARSSKKWLRHLVEQVFFSTWSFFGARAKNFHLKQRYSTCDKLPKKHAF